MDQSSTQQLCHAFQAAWNAHDMKALGSIFANDATFIGRFGTFMRGREEIEASHQRIHAGPYRSSKIEIGEPEITMLGDDVAVLLFRTRLALDPNDANADVVSTFAQAVAVAVGGSWSIKSMANVECKQAGAR